jgi:hypothetical protein
MALAFLVTFLTIQKAGAAVWYLPDAKYPPQYFVPTGATTPIFPFFLYDGVVSTNRIKFPKAICFNKLIESGIV